MVLLPARLFHCEIMNKGQGPVSWANDLKDNGELVRWSGAFGG